MYRRPWDVALLAFCIHCGTSSELRVPSPGGALDAVIVERNGGATTLMWHDVYVVGSHGSARARNLVASFYGALRLEDSTRGVSLRWPDSTTLRIEYLCANEGRIVRSELRVSGKSVSVVVSPPGVPWRTCQTIALLPNTRLKLSAPVVYGRIAFVNRTARRRSLGAPR